MTSFSLFCPEKHEPEVPSSARRKQECIEEEEIFTWVKKQKSWCEHQCGCHQNTHGCKCHIMGEPDSSVFESWQSLKMIAKEKHTNREKEELGMTHHLVIVNKILHQDLFQNEFDNIRRCCLSNTVGMLEHAWTLEIPNEKFKKGNKNNALVKLGA